MRKIAILIGILFYSKIAAAQPAWLLQPTICIAQQPGDSCQLTFKMVLSDIPDDYLCLYIANQQHSCASRSTFPTTVTVWIDKITQVELKNATQQTLLSHDLLIKYQKTTNQRRRVRPPWSLF